MLLRDDLAGSEAILIWSPPSKIVNCFPEKSLLRLALLVWFGWYRVFWRIWFLVGVSPAGKTVFEEGYLFGNVTIWSLRESLKRAFFTSITPTKPSVCLRVIPLLASEWFNLRGYICIDCRDCGFASFIISDYSLFWNINVCASYGDND